MSCDYCEKKPLSGQVVNSRPHKWYVIRRRKCYQCYEKITTYEIIAGTCVLVDKNRMLIQCKVV